MADTIPSRLLGRAQETTPAYATRGEAGWETRTWQQYVAEVRTAARALIAHGVGPGDVVCILGFNRPEWTILDLAAMCIGAAPAGIYTTSPADDIRYILGNSDCKLILVENLAHLATVNSVRADVPSVQHVVLMAPATSETATSWTAFLDRASEVPGEEIDRRVAGLGDDQLGTLIYTSGTTGFPKGVMLSHKNLAWTADTAKDMACIGPSDSCLSYLPLSHIAEQMFSIHVHVTTGGTISFARSLETLKDDLVEVRPTIFFGVPRVWEKFHAAISGKLAGATGLKKWLVAQARAAGAEASAELNAGREPGGLLALRYALFSKLIFSKLKPAIGLGRARLCVSGAAPISKDVLDFFGSLDIRIHEVYGQSEGSGPTSFSLPGKNRIGTVGPALPGAEVRVLDDGEICLRGPNVFLGYLKDPTATAETVIDGWLHSGDLGSFDADGYLSITGRKKEILVTSGGKNIAPVRVEAALKQHPLVGEAVAIGDRRHFLSALITLEPGAAARFAEAHGVAVDRVAISPELVAEIQRAVDAANGKLAQVEHVRKFTVLPRELTVADGELTPSLKLKRRVITKNWAKEIEAMYA
jgi:long-chain acyl-CoA synthetase